jgi:hypothetical protein
MKYMTKLNVALFLFATVVCSACDEDDETPIIRLEAETVADLNSVSSKNFTLFSFANNTVPNSDSATTKWDIGFRGTTIILNSGASGPGQAGGQIVHGIFDELLEAPATGYAQDTPTTKAILGNGGWYTYTGSALVPNNAILPLAGKILVLKTADQKFVKVEILSYYLGNPSTTTAAFADLATRPASRYYTFRFIYQADGTSNLETTK